MAGIYFCNTQLMNMGTALEVFFFFSIVLKILSFTTDTPLTWEVLLITLPYSGSLDLSEKCFQELILKDQNHPAALINYAALLLCKYGSVVAGMLLKSLTSCLMNSTNI